MATTARFALLCVLFATGCRGKVKESTTFQDLQDIRDTLGNHTLFKAMGGALDWLTRHQISSSSLSNSSVCDSDKNITNWQGAFAGDYHASENGSQGHCIFHPPTGPFWHAGQAVKALVYGSTITVPEGVPANASNKSRAQWMQAALRGGDFLLGQIRDDGLVQGALENSNVYPQTSTAVEGLTALFALGKRSNTSREFIDAGIKAASWYTKHAW
eukprot:m.88026 g.88026  ORF g.88026 m.88026 type:complete len:215 (+) comp13137_c0_seq1:148-792(+)